MYYLLYSCIYFIYYAYMYMHDSATCNCTCTCNMHTTHVVCTTLPYMAAVINLVVNSIHEWISCIPRLWINSKIGVCLNLRWQVTKALNLWINISSISDSVNCLHPPTLIDLHSHPRLHVYHPLFTTLALFFQFPLTPPLPSPYTHTHTHHCPYHTPSTTHCNIFIP